MTRKRRLREGEAPAEPLTPARQEPRPPRIRCSWCSTKGNAMSNEPKQPPLVQLPDRKHPEHGVLIKDGEPTIVFVTVCTKDRKPWLATHENHAVLRSVWARGNGLAGRTLRFAPRSHPPLRGSHRPRNLPRRLGAVLEIEDCRKRQCPGQHGRRTSGTHDCGKARATMRSRSVNNSVRHGLVAKAEDWPFQGELLELPWWEPAR